MTTRLVRRANGMARAAQTPTLASGLRRARYLMSCLCLLAGLSPAGAAPPSLPPPDGKVLLTVSGNITRVNNGDSAQLDRAMLKQLPAHVLRTSTSATEGTHVFEGVLMRDLLEHLGATGTVVIATALNDYASEIPVDDLHTYDVMAALTMDGVRLTPRDKGPLWIVYPRDDHEELQDIRYDYRWVWQLKHLEVR